MDVVSILTIILSVFGINFGCLLFLLNRMDSGFKKVREEMESGNKDLLNRMDSGNKDLLNRMDSGFKALREEIQKVREGVLWIKFQHGHVPEEAKEN